MSTQNTRLRFYVVMQAFCRFAGSKAFWLRSKAKHTREIFRAKALSAAVPLEPRFLGDWTVTVKRDLA